MLFAFNWITFWPFYWQPTPQRDDFLDRSMAARQPKINGEMFSLPDCIQPSKFIYLVFKLLFIIQRWYAIIIIFYPKCLCIKIEKNLGHGNETWFNEIYRYEWMETNWKCYVFGFVFLVEWLINKTKKKLMKEILGPKFSIQLWPSQQKKLEPNSSQFHYNYLI